MTTSNVIQLSRREKEDLHSVLRRACERAERRAASGGNPGAEAEADMLAQEVAALAAELARMP